MTPKAKVRKAKLELLTYEVPIQKVFTRSVHFEADDCDVVITKRAWTDIGQPLSLRVVLTEEHDCA